jgi:hypothetical protein
MHLKIKIFKRTNRFYHLKIDRYFRESIIRKRGHIKLKPS